MHCSGSIRIIDLESGRKKKLSDSFNGDISCLQFSEDGFYLACVSGDVKEVVIYSVQEREQDQDQKVDESDKEKSALCIIPIPSSAQSVYLKEIGEDSLTLDVLVILETSVMVDKAKTSDNEQVASVGALLFRIYADNDNNTARFTQTSLRHSSSYNIANANFSHVNESSLCVALHDGTTTGSLPQFVHVSYIDSNRQTPFEEILLDGLIANNMNTISNGHNKEEVTTIANENGKYKGEVEILGAFQMGPSKRPIVSTDNEPSLISKKKLKLGTIDSNNNVSAADMNGADDGLSLETRLKELGDELTRYDEVEDGNAISFIANPTSDSLVTLVEQALQSNDDVMLEQCLGCGDVNVIEETTRRLPAGKAIAFMQKLIAKFEKKPSRGVLLTKWLSGVLRWHASFLLSIPDLGKQLSGLTYMLENRLSTYSKLVSLSGRLDILLGQQVTLSSSGTVMSSNSQRQNLSKTQQAESFDNNDVYYE